MSEFLIQDTTLEDIADAIRAKKGTQAGIQVSDFPSEIASIPTGSSGAQINPHLYSFNSLPSILLDHVFKYNNTYYAIGVVVRDANTSYIRLYSLTNGVWTYVGGLNTFSASDYEQIYNSLQYVVYGSYLYFMYKTSLGTELYYVDLSQPIDYGVSCTLPYSSYNYCLMQKPSDDAIYVYCPNNDYLYSVPINPSTGELSSVWVVISSRCFGTTSSSAYATGCYYDGGVSGWDGLYISRSDQNRYIYWFDVDNEDGRSISDENGRTFTPISCMFSISGNGVYGLSPVINDTTYGSRPYSYCYKFGRTSSSQFWMYTYRTSFIPRNDCKFFDGNNQCLNGGGGCVYPDSTLFTPTDVNGGFITI